jgi:hypothetical protein
MQLATRRRLVPLFDLRDTTGVLRDCRRRRSPLYTLAVVDLPYVQSLALVYRFPAYTGLEPVREEDAGDIAALVGTRVDVEVVPTIATSGGALVVGTDTVALVPGAATLTGEIEVRASGSYRVLLAAPDGRLVPASPEYFIDALDDQPPIVRFSQPGRDVSVTSVDEVFAEVSAEDDYGLRRVELVYAVNGGPPSPGLWAADAEGRDRRAHLYLRRCRSCRGRVAYYAGLPMHVSGEPAVMTSTS